MPNALVGSIALLDDLVDDFPMKNIDLDWMYLQPNTLLWAENIYVPSRFLSSPPEFQIDVGFEQSNIVLSRSMEQAWHMLVEAGVILPVPITPEIRESAVISYYSVHNRINQTAGGNLPNIGMDVAANLTPDSPPQLLQLEEHQYCSNHLDSVAAHLVVSQNTDSIWLSDERDENAVRWLYCGGMDPETIKPRARKSVIDNISILRLPKCDFLPPVASCGTCGNNGSTCYTENYGVENWIAGAKHRLNQILELRTTNEISNLRQLISDVSNRVNKSEFDSFALDHVAAAEIRAAGEIAEKRIDKTIPDIKKYCDIAALYSVPIAMFAANPGLASILGPIAGALAVGSKVVSTASKLLLQERHSWLKLRQIDL